MTDAADWYAGKQVVIPGGLGFIGSNLARRLADLGARVRVLDNLMPGQGGNPANIEGVEEIEWIELDVRERSLLEPRLADADVVFNTVGQTSHPLSMQDPLLDLDLNAAAHLAVLDVCRRVAPDCAVLYTATRQVYGAPIYQQVDEAHPLLPPDANAVSNLAAEQYSALYHRLYGLRTCCLRLTNIYGPRMQLRGNQHGFTGVFLRSALCGEKIQIFGDGHQVREFLYVDDLVDAMVRVAATDACAGQVLNVGSGQASSVLQFAEALQVQRPLELEYVPFPEEREAIEIEGFVCDHSALRAATGWQPQTPLADGLAATLDWFSQRQAAYL